MRNTWFLVYECKAFFSLRTRRNMRIFEIFSHSSRNWSLFTCVKPHVYYKISKANLEIKEKWLQFIFLETSLNVGYHSLLEKKIFWTAVILTLSTSLFVTGIDESVQRLDELLYTTLSIKYFLTFPSLNILEAGLSLFPRKKFEFYINSKLLKFIEFRRELLGTTGRVGTIGKLNFYFQMVWFFEQVTEFFTEIEKYSRHPWKI